MFIFISSSAGDELDGAFRFSVLKILTIISFKLWETATKKIQKNRTKTIVKLTMIV